MNDLKRWTRRGGGNQNRCFHPVSLEFGTLYGCDWNYEMLFRKKQEMAAGDFLLSLSCRLAAPGMMKNTHDWGLGIVSHGAGGAVGSEADFNWC
jgi:hypothetical protein